MSVVKLLDTNTVLAPIKLCVGGKKYEIAPSEIYRYSLDEKNGNIQLHIGEWIIPLIKSNE